MVKKNLYNAFCVFLLSFILVILVTKIGLTSAQGFSDNTDLNTGIRTVVQYAKSTGFLQSEKRTEYIDVPKKSFASIKLTVNIENGTSRGKAIISKNDVEIAILNSTTNDTKSTTVILYPGEYKLYTYGVTGVACGTGEGIIEMTIQPYLKLNYEECNQGGYGQGTVEIYKNKKFFKSASDDTFIDCLAGDKICCVATSDKGYNFVRWEGAATGTSLTSATFTMNKDKTVRAVFADTTVGDVTGAKIQQNGDQAVFSWSDSIKNQEGSGIKRYEIALTNTTSKPTSGIISVIGKTIHTFKNLDSKKKYYAWVRAVDNAGNKSKNWARVGPFSRAPEQANFLSVTPRYSITNNQPSYRVDLKISDVNAATYLLHRKVFGTDTWTQIASLSYSSLSQNNFSFTDTNNLQKHKKYIYKIITKNVLQQSSAESYSNKIVIPNISPDVADKIIVSNSDENNIDLNNPFYTNNKTFIVNVPTLDIEGDALKYQVIYSKDNGNWQTYFTKLETGSSTVTFSNDGEYQWYLQIAEFDGSEEITTADPKDSDKPPRTVVPESGMFKFIIDTTAPAESANNFSLYNSDKSLKYNQDQPTNKQEVIISEINLFDNLGVNYACFWNGSTMPSKFYSLNHAVENNNLKPQIKAEIESATAGITIDAQTTIGDIPWILSSGSDGNRTVRMQVLDITGNQLIKTLTVKLDTTAPSAPDLVGFSHDHSENNGQKKINFIWQNSVDDVTNFMGTYLVNGQTLDINQKDIKLTKDNGVVVTGSYSITVNEFGANQPVTISISAIDKAGNNSKTYSKYIAYTEARLGQIAYQEQESGYDQLNDGHFMKFKLIDSGEASKQALEYGTISGDEFVSQGELDRVTDTNYFIHQGLNPHQEKYYRLVAFNNSNDKTIGQPLRAQVPNIPPVAPVINDDSYPRDFNVIYNQDSQVVFHYQPGSDVDGDDILHTIYWALGDNPGENEFKQIKVGDPQSIPLTKENLVHEKSYTWYVKVEEIEDIYQLQNESQRITFIVDKQTPLIEGDKIDDLYTNKQSLKVIATDHIEENNPNEIYSDIKRVFYQKNHQSLDYPIDLTSSSEGKWMGEITLEAGEYSLQVYAQDKAGNISTEPLNYQLKIDHTPPEVSEVKIDLELDSGRYNTYQSFIPLEVSITDPVVNNVASGSKNLIYWFVENLGDEDNTPGQTISLIDSSTTCNLTLDMSGVVDNRQYYLILQVEDRAGNISQKKYPGQIYIDTTRPEVSLELTGYKIYGSQNYLANLNSLVSDTLAEDNESGIRAEEYNIYSAKKPGYINDQWSDWHTVKQTVLTDGETYSLAFRGTNGVGNSATVISEGFIFDSSQPQNLVLDISAGVVVSDETVILSIGASDEDSPITSFKLAIGLTPGGSELTSAIYGNQAGWLEMKLINGEYRLVIPDVADGTYYPTLAVTNAAGSTSTLKGQTIEVDNHQEKLIVNDQGPYTAFADQLTANWQYVGDKKIVEYQYRIKIKGGSYLTEIRSTDLTQMTLENLQLTHGETYQFEIRAETDDDLVLTELSPGITVDTSGPVLDFLNIPEYSVSEKIRFDWQGSDPESGVMKVEVALGSDYKLTDVTAGWIELVDNHLNCQDLNLTTGQRYYTVFRITNGAGTQIDRAGSPVIIDDTPPPVPEIEDRVVYINYEQPFTIDMTNTILMNKIDAESGNQEYYWTYSPDQDTLVLENQTLEWSQLDDLKLRFNNIYDLLGSSQIIDGTTYYFAIKVINGAGLMNIAVSDGVTIDNSAPSIPELKVLHTTNLGEDVEVNYINSIDNLKLWIGSTDVHSTVNKYLYAYGQLEELAHLPRQEELINDPSEYNQPKVISIIDPELEEGQIYYFVGESCNGATIISQTGYSSGLIFDASVPEIIDVNGTASADKLIFDWDVDLSSTLSAIVRYEVGLVTDPALQPGEWIDMGLAKTKTVDATTLPDGEYYLKIRAYNAAGNYSQQNNGMGISPLVILDRTKPEVTKIEHTNYTHQEMSAIIKAEDNLSGISCYQYALGNLCDATIYSAGWIEINNISDHPELKDQIEVILASEQIPHAEEIYLRARVKDNVDLWSDTLAGAKIIVDHQPPVAVKITGPECINTTSKIDGVDIAYSDPESGVTHYRLSVAEKVGGDWLTDPKIQLIETFNHQITGLELLERDYYLILEVFNRVGLSTVVYSEQPVTIDITPPIIEFIDTTDEIVFNHPGVVDYSLSEQANVFLTLINPDGSSLTQQYNQLEPGKTHSFSFEETSYGVYTLSAQVIDMAGNSMPQTVEKKIRVNEPPTITFSEDEDGIAFYTTPGKPVQLLPYQVYDPDGGTIASYEWDFGDASAISSDALPEHIYEQLGIYTVSVKVTDNDAGETIVTTKIKVENTQQGSLYRDETWSGEHSIMGDVIVPEDRILTILPGTKVLIDGIPGVSGYNHQILIQGKLIIGKKDGSSNEAVNIQLVDDGTGNWQGIHVEGVADLTNVVIEDALRALTVAKAGEVKLIDGSIMNNVIGVHTCGTRPTIENTLFINNSRYGIKEDQDGRPIVINCTFNNNWIDYYHQKLSQITMDELNNLEGNSGNHH